MLTTRTETTQSNLGQSRLCLTFLYRAGHELHLLYYYWTSCSHAHGRESVDSLEQVSSGGPDIENIEPRPVRGRHLTSHGDGGEPCVEPGPQEDGRPEEWGDGVIHEGMSLDEVEICI